MEMNGKLRATAALPLKEFLLSSEQEAGWTSQLVWEF
jgi:hypothetical protein